jgi:TRAP-type C4-dicarboxylate transport system permease small subunit
MIVVSVVGRGAAGKPIQGDVELTQLGVGLAISLGLPWCQWQRANIIVDFFTQSARPAWQRVLDALGACAVAAMAGLLAWRSAVGAQAVMQAQETSMILGLPMWWIYAALAPGLALTTLVALYQVVRPTAPRSPDELPT